MDTNSARYRNTQEQVLKNAQDIAEMKETETDIQETLEELQTNLGSHIDNTNNPHGVTKAQVGLGNVDNTSDEAKPISNATQTALNGKLNVPTIILAPNGGIVNGYLTDEQMALINSYNDVIIIFGRYKQFMYREYDSTGYIYFSNRIEEAVVAGQGYTVTQQEMISLRTSDKFWSYMNKRVADYYSKSQNDLLLADKQSLINKNLYNLGAFDTYVDNNDGTITITRKTRYVDLSTLTWVYDSIHNAWESIVSGYENPTTNNDKANILSENYITDTVNNIIANSTINTIGLNNIVSPDTSLYVYNGSLNDTPTGYLYYETSTSYTETVIKNQPLNTLNQKGSQWVQDEYEKTLQIWNETTRDGYWQSSSGNYVYANNQLCSNRIPVKPNTTYTFTDINTHYSIHAYESDNTWIGEIVSSPTNLSTTFTTPNNCYNITFNLGAEYGTTYNNNVMLNEGSNALPYQPYNGAIIHEKEFNTKLPKPPTTAGTYTLTCTVDSSGNPTYSWS